MTSPSPSLTGDQWVQWRSCASKRPYLSRRQARNAAKAIPPREDGQRPEPYSCAWCGRFHLGHRRRMPATQETP